MPRRVRRAPRKRKREDDAPAILASDRDAFEAELEERAVRWSDAYTESRPSDSPVVEQLPLELQRSHDLMKELDHVTEGTPHA